VAALQVLLLFVLAKMFERMLREVELIRHGNMAFQWMVATIKFSVCFVKIATQEASIGSSTIYPGQKAIQVDVYMFMMK
jgi:hypothetical protein